MHPMDFYEQNLKNKIKFQEKGSTAKKHFQISLIKSIIRIGACAVLCYGNYIGAGIGLGIAEVLGIYEEIA
jgi:hypothetical protein